MARLESCSAFCINRHFHRLLFTGGIGPWMIDRSWSVGERGGGGKSGAGERLRALLHRARGAAHRVAGASRFFCDSVYVGGGGGGGGGRPSARRATTE